MAMREMVCTPTSGEMSVHGKSGRARLSRVYFHSPVLLAVKHENLRVALPIGPWSLSLGVMMTD